MDTTVFIVHFDPGDDMGGVAYSSMGAGVVFSICFFFINKESFSVDTCEIEKQLHA